MTAPTGTADNASESVSETGETEIWKPPHRFLSDEPLDSPPSCTLADFRCPRLRRYPKPFRSLVFRRVLGRGLDGFVFRARTEDNAQVAVKFFFDSERPKPIPRAFINPYWAFETECYNSAILSMMSTRLRQGPPTERPLFLLPNPNTRRDAWNNIKAFSDEYVEDYRAKREAPEGTERFTQEDVRIRGCLGWMEAETELVRNLVDRFNRAIRHNNIYHYIENLPEQPKIYAIVYEYVEPGPIDMDVLDQQFNFFYLAGFAFVPIRLENWIGAGTLVDFCDIVPIKSHLWGTEHKYGRARYNERLQDFLIMRPLCTKALA